VKGYCLDVGALSRKAVSSLRLARGGATSRAIMGRYACGPEAMRLGPRRPGEEARGPLHPNIAASWWLLAL